MNPSQVSHLIVTFVVVVNKIVDISDDAGLDGSSFHFGHNGAFVSVRLQESRITVKLHQLEYLSLRWEK